MNFKTNLITKGCFEAYIKEKNQINQIYKHSNQIQYAGAHDIAIALTNKSTIFPKLSNIITTIPQEVDPGTSKPKTWNLPFTDTTQISGYSFSALPSSIDQQQIIICQATFSDYLLTEQQTEGKYYEFALALDTGNALAYEYIKGGLFWGSDQALLIIWTLYLGTK